MNQKAFVQLLEERRQRAESSDRIRAAEGQLEQLRADISKSEALRVQLEQEVEEAHRDR